MGFIGGTDTNSMLVLLLLPLLLLVIEREAAVVDAGFVPAQKQHCRLNNVPPHCRLLAFPPPPSLQTTSSSSLAASPDLFAQTLSDAATTMTMAASSPGVTATTPAVSSDGMLSQETAIAVFVVGLIPFAIATVEFWRRIAVGASFGTNQPVVFIGQDDNPNSSRGKQVLGRDSLITAYVIFAVVAAVLGLVLFSVVTTPLPE